VVFLGNKLLEFSAQFLIGSPGTLPLRVPGLPISNCASYCNMLAPSNTKVSAIDVTQKVFFECLYFLPLSRSVLPESRPFEVTTLWRGKGGVRKREWEVYNRGGENEGINVWSFEASTLEKGLPQVFIPAAPIRAGEFIITNIWSLNARLSWREEFFTSTHLLWSQAPRWGDSRLDSQWAHSPIYSHPWSSPLETYFISIHELISRIS